MRDLFTKTGSRLFAFDSSSDLLAYTDSRHFSRRDYEFVGRDLPKWHDVELASTQVWSDGQKVLQRFVQRLAAVSMPDLKDKRRRIRFSEDDGSELDLDRLRSGQPYWRDSRREDTPGPVEVTVIIDTSTSASVDPKNILWRGASALALTTLLEERGYRVELWVVSGSQLFAKKPYGVVTACCLKRCGDTLDSSTLLNSVSGWFYRTATFTMLRTLCAKCGETEAFGLGMPYCPRPKDLDEISRDEHRVYVSGVYTFYAAVSLLEAEIKKLAAR